MDVVVNLVCSVGVLVLLVTALWVLKDGIARLEYTPILTVLGMICIATVIGGAGSALLWIWQ